MEESNNTKPLISIITVVLNDKDNIEKTILSVLNQNYKNIQYIIIDGGSSDGTIDIIKKYEKNIGFWVSEKDKGIYDAFNKGLKHTNGDLIGFTNSGDTLTNESLDYLVDYYNNYKEADFFFGAVKKHWGILHGYKKWKIYFTWGFYSSHSTGFYIKKKAAKILGNYNLKYKYSSDYDYFYRMIIKYKFKGVGTKKKELFGYFTRGGYSSQINFFDHLVECTRIRLDNKQNKFIVLLTFIFKFICNLKRI
jgi:glycosyltransferase involved in cell wall biosynthesis|tara:strand:- start:59 stop:808 length:750 start_codon:yes stop_codon:yes gene_type:complete